MNLETMGLLQLFAEGAVTGEQTAAAAGQQTAQTTRANPPADASSEAQAAVPDAAAQKPSWEELMRDPHYNRQMQQTVQARLKTARAAEETLGRLSPALQVLARRYGLDPEKPDYDAISRHICGEEAQKPSFQTHFQALQKQAEELRRAVPGFELSRALLDPAFVRLTAPGSPLTVEDAYFVLHREALQAAAEEAAVRKVSGAVQAGMLRPKESGGGGSTASVGFDYRAASPRQRAELKQRMRQAAARGEKVYPR